MGVSCSKNKVKTGNGGGATVPCFSGKEGPRMNILLIGAGDSGKTTLKKQLVNVHAEPNAFNDTEFRCSFRTTILANLLEGTLAVLNLTDGEQETIEMLKDEMRCFPSELTPKLAQTLIDIIWKTSKFQELLQTKSNDAQVQDCWYVFAKRLKEYPEWGGSSWIPNVEDCVRCRSRTSGVIRTNLKLYGHSLCFIDVGGQRPERRKWETIWKEVNAVIFMLALSEYDQNLFEDRSKNRLEEAFNLFEEQLPQMKNKTILIFANKYDLFLEKYVKNKVPLNISGKFPKAPTGNDDPKKAIDWILGEFSRMLNSKSHLHSHIMTATDPVNVKHIFENCTQVLLEKNMKSMGF